MSKALRQNVILELLEERSVGSQEDLQRALRKRGLKVGQATLSRDIHELGLVKTGTGYMLPGEAASDRLAASFATGSRIRAGSTTSAEPNGHQDHRWQRATGSGRA